MPFARSQGNCSNTSAFYGNTYSAAYSTSMTFPTIGNTYPHMSAQIDDTTVLTASRVSKGHITNCNVALIEASCGSGQGGTAIDTSMAILGYANNIRT